MSWLTNISLGSRPFLSAYFVRPRKGSYCTYSRRFVLLLIYNWPCIIEQYYCSSHVSSLILQCFIQGGALEYPPQTSDLPPPPPPQNSFLYTNFLNRIIHQLQSNAPIFIHFRSLTGHVLYIQHTTSSCIYLLVSKMKPQCF